MKILVHAKPKAKANSIEQLSPTEFKISVTSPPTKGLANKAISKIIAEYFNVAPLSVHLIVGASSKHKIFEF